MDPRIRIYTKMSWIRNTVYQVRNISIKNTVYVPESGSVTGVEGVKYQKFSGSMSTTLVKESVPIYGNFATKKVYLFLGPGCLLNLRVEMVVPALPALLPNATLEVLGNEGPTLRPILLHQVHHLLVLLFGPGS
jgi:hypothetical protein